MTVRLPFVASIENPELRAIFEAIQLALVDWRGLMFTGAGSPETVVTASPPAIYLNRSGGAGTTLYVKESGANTNTGWVAK